LNDTQVTGALHLSSPHLLRRLIKAGALVVALLQIWHFLGFLLSAIGSVRYKYSLDYGEGIVWQQALLIPSGKMYGDITQYPFIVFHYPPFYHLAVRAIAATGADMLETGRAVSLLASFAIAAVAARLTFLVSASLGRTGRWIGTIVAAVTIFCYDPVVTWSVLMRADLLAVALCFAGVLCAITAGGKPWRVYAAGFLFLFAMYTKQTSIAAPLATFPVLLVIDRRRALGAAAAVLVVGLAVLLGLELYTDGGFLRHIVLYNINRYEFSEVVAWVRSQWRHSVFFLTALAGIAYMWRTAGRRGPGVFKRDIAENSQFRATLVVSLYMAATTATIATIGKSGASNNYFIETMCVWSIPIGVLIGACADRVAGYLSGERSAAQIWDAIPPILLLTGQMLFMDTSGGEYERLTPAYIEGLNGLEAQIAQAAKPVLSEDMVLLLLAGKQVPWEPAIFAELASQGRWDEHLITDRIDAHGFAMIITTEQPDSGMDPSLFSPAVRRSIETAYPRTEIVSGRVVHRPAD